LSNRLAAAYANAVYAAKRDSLDRSRCRSDHQAPRNRSRATPPEQLQIVLEEAPALHDQQCLPPSPREREGAASGLEARRPHCSQPRFSHLSPSLIPQIQVTHTIVGGK